MKSVTRLWFLLLVISLVMAVNTFAYAQGDTPVTDDEVNELAREIYCPVCENVPLEVCPTKACAQWRDLIREKMELGWSDKQIREFFAAQYGDQVLAVPPRKGLNWVIYLLPPLVLAGGLFVTLRVIRRAQRTSPPQGDPAGARSAGAESLMDKVEEDLRRGV